MYLKWCILFVIIFEASQAQIGSDVSSAIDSVPILGSYHIPQYVNSGIGAYRTAQSFNKMANNFGLAPIVQHPTTIRLGADVGITALQTAQNLNNAYSDFIDSDFVGLSLYPKMFPKGLPYISQLPVPPSEGTRLIAAPAAMLLLSSNPFSHYLERRSIKEEEENQKADKDKSSELLNPLDQDNTSDEYKEVLGSSGSLSDTTTSDATHQAKIRSSVDKQTDKDFSYLSKAANPSDGFDDIKQRFNTMMKKVGKEITGVAKSVDSTLRPSHATYSKGQSFDESGDPYKVYVDNTQAGTNGKINSDGSSVSGLMKKYLKVMNDKNVAKLSPKQEGGLAPELRSAMDAFKESLSKSTLMNKFNEKSSNYRSEPPKSKASEKSENKPTTMDKNDNPVGDVWSKASELASKVVESGKNKASELASSVKNAFNTGKDELSKIVGTHHHPHTPIYHSKYANGYPNYQPNYYQQIIDSYYSPYKNTGYLKNAQGVPAQKQSSVTQQALDLASGIWNRDPAKITNAGVGLGDAISNGYPALYNNPGYLPKNTQSAPAQNLYPSSVTQQALDLASGIWNRDPEKITNAGVGLGGAVSNGNQAIYKNPGYSSKNIQGTKPSTVTNQALNLAAGILSGDPAKITNAGVGLGGAISNADPNVYPSRIFRQADGKPIANSNLNAMLTGYLQDYIIASDLANDVNAQAELSRNYRQLPIMPIISSGLGALSQGVISQYDPRHFLKANPDVATQAAALAGSIVNGNVEGIAGASVKMGTGIADPFLATRNSRQVGGDVFDSSIKLADGIVRVSTKDPSEIQSKDVFSAIKEITAASHGIAGGLHSNGAVKSAQTLKSDPELRKFTMTDFTKGVVDNISKEKDDETSPVDAHIKSISSSAKGIVGGVSKALNLDKPSQNYAKAPIDLASTITQIATNPQNAKLVSLAKNPVTAQWSPYFSQIVSLANGRSLYGNGQILQSYYNPYLLQSGGYITPYTGIWTSALNMASGITDAATSLNKNQV